MKILSIFNVCLVGALILGVWAAWSAIAPQLISGEQLEGGCPPCLSVKENSPCGDTGGGTCNRYWTKCTGTSEDLICYDIRESSCMWSDYCVNHKDQSCH